MGNKTGKALPRMFSGAVHDHVALSVEQAPIDKRSNAQVGRPLLFNAQDLIKRNDFSGALSEIVKFKSLYLECRWSDDMAHWKTALEAAGDCKWEEGFIETIIFYSISDVKIKLREWVLFEQNAATANSFLRKAGR